MLIVNFFIIYGFNNYKVIILYKLSYVFKIVVIYGMIFVLERGWQNLFLLDGVCDVLRWVYILVKIINERDVFGLGFNSLIIVWDQFIFGVDIYNFFVYMVFRFFFYQIRG